MALDRKPKSGCELKTASCRKSGIIIRIEITMSAEDICSKDYESDHCHDTTDLLRLLEPWFHTNRIVCADSLFVSIATAQKILEKDWNSYLSPEQLRSRNGL